jgi:hypothetical protein
MRLLAAAALLGWASAGAPVAFAGQATNPDTEPRYDAAAVINVMATIAEVRETPRAGPLAGVHFLLKTDKESIDSHLGPSDFLKEFGVAFAKGDRVQIVGSRVKSGEGFVVLVREVRKDTSTLYLRDQKGNPNWPPPAKGKN